MLGVALRMPCFLFPKIQMVAGGCFFQSIFTSTKLYWFWRNFKNSEIDCTSSEKKNHSELQKFKKGNVATLWLFKKLWLRRPETFENKWQKRDHFLRTLFNVAGVLNIKLLTDCFYGLIFSLLDNTNYVMQNLIPKFRQSSIIS